MSKRGLTGNQAVAHLKAGCPIEARCPVCGVALVRFDLVAWQRLGMAEVERQLAAAVSEHAAATGHDLEKRRAAR